MRFNGVVHVPVNNETLCCDFINLYNVAVSGVLGHWEANSHPRCLKTLLLEEK